MVNDLIVIGGGAAGLCAAVYFKQNNPNATVRILEAQPRVGKKLALTGNGRCNITNKEPLIERYHGKNPEFAEYALEKYNLSFTADFFSKIGVDFVFEDNKGYPSSLQAASVVDCLRFACDELGVLTHTETPVTKIQISNGKYKIISNQLSFLAENVIIATGLLSGGDRLGCDGKMLAILEKAGFKTVKTSPAIVQLKTENDVVKQLKGIKLDAAATLKTENGFERTDCGEVLFCDYGLSGPPILQISREAGRTDSKAFVSLDIMPDMDFSELFTNLEKRVKNLKNRTLDEFFTGFLNKRVGQVLCKLIGCSLRENAASLDNAKLKKLTALMKDWSFAVTGTTGFANSQVTAGGLETNGFESKTMESKMSRGLYAIGEILDIDGDCGGFNLQWAWSSAFCAADAIGNSRK